MYFLDEKSLVADLAARRVPARDQAIYLCLVVGLYVPLWAPTPADSPADLYGTGLKLATSLAGIAIPILGVRRCYQMNGGGEGVRLLEKFVPLAWVVGFQIAILVIPAYLIVIAAFTQSFGPFISYSTIPVQIVYYWKVSLLVSHLRELELHAA